MFLFFFLTSSASGMDILNGAIDSLISSSNKEDWTPVALNVADATVTISKEKVSNTHLSLPNYYPCFSSLCSFLLPVWKIKFDESPYATVTAWEVWHYGTYWCNVLHSQRKQTPFFIKAEIHKFLHILPLYGSVIDNKDGRASKGQVVRTFFLKMPCHVIYCGVAKW